jgi:hypothetical protein
LKFPLDALHETAYITQMPNDTTGNVPQGRPVEVAQKAGCGSSKHSEGDCGADAEVSASSGSQSAWLGLSCRDRKLIEATIMALYHACDGSFSDYCDDSEFGNELLEWLRKQTKRITSRP